jgi:hypothetical protein
LQSFSTFPTQSSKSSHIKNVNPLAPNGKNEEEGDEDSTGEDDTEKAGKSTFGEKLRAVKDDETPSDEEEQKLVLQEQESKSLHTWSGSVLMGKFNSAMTGEEEEQTIHQVRGKLYALADNSWKERGTGTLKLNVRRSDGHGARLGMTSFLSLKNEFLILYCSHAQGGGLVTAHQRSSVPRHARRCSAGSTLPSVQRHRRWEDYPLQSEGILYFFLLATRFPHHLL